MANQGLKSCVKTLKQEIGVVKGNINLNGDCANLHLTIPILSSVGLNPIKASLIFNYQDRGVDGLFGKGFKLNYYTKINEGTSELTMLNADGSSDVYQAPDYKNQETQLTIEKVYDAYPTYHYLINDKYDNVIYYNLNKEYPYYIEQKNGENLVAGILIGLACGFIMGATAGVGGGIIATALATGGSIATQLLIGGAIAIGGGIIAGGGGEIAHQIVKYGGVQDWENVIMAAATAGAVNLLVAFIGGYIGGIPGFRLDYAIPSPFFAIMSTSINSIIDMIILYYVKNKEKIYDEE